MVRGVECRGFQLQPIIFEQHTSLCNLIQGFLKRVTGRTPSAAPAKPEEYLAEPSSRAELPKLRLSLLLLLRKCHEASSPRVKV